MERLGPGFLDYQYWVGPVLAVALGWFIGQAAGCCAAWRRRAHFLNGLRAELRRCLALDLRVSDDTSLLNHLAFPFVTAMATRGEYLSDLSPEAAGAVLNVHYCLDRFHRFAEIEVPLVRDLYSPDPKVQRNAKTQLGQLRSAAVSELEASLKTLACLGLDHLARFSWPHVRIGR